MSGKYHTTPDVNPRDFAPHGSGLPTPEELYKLRVKAGLSMKEAARRAGVVRATVMQSESDEVNTRNATIRDLLGVYRGAIRE